MRLASEASKKTLRVDQRRLPYSSEALRRAPIKREIKHPLPPVAYHRDRPRRFGTGLRHRLKAAHSHDVFLGRVGEGFGGHDGHAQARKGAWAQSPGYAIQIR